MSRLIFRFPAPDESAARDQAAELAAIASLEPVQVTRDGSDVRVEIHHPLVLLLSRATDLVCCCFGCLSEFLCPHRAHDYKPQGTQGA
jgi:hypothetical protein